MRLLLLGIELPNVTAVQGLHHADPRKHRRPFRRRHQNSRLYNDAREVRDRLFVDDRWFRFSQLPDFRHISASQDRSQWGKVSWTNKENDMKKTLIIAAA